MSEPKAAATAAAARGEARSEARVGEEIVRALGPLAARPLTEQVSARMRRVLARAGSPAVRDALRRRRRPASGAGNRDVTLVPAAAKARRRQQAPPGTRLGGAGRGFAAAGAW